MDKLPDFSNKLENIFQFLVKARELQNVYRATPKENGQFENDAEHCYMVALAIIMLADLLDEEFGVKLDRYKMCMMAIIHDMAEIGTGDTATWDKAARIGKEERERVAFYDLTEGLYDDLKTEVRNLWEECEAMSSPEAKVVKSIDRLDPVFHRYTTKLGWANVEGRDGTVEALDERQLPRHSFSQTITALYVKLRDLAISENMFRKSE